VVAATAGQPLLLPPEVLGAQLMKLQDFPLRPVAWVVRVAAVAAGVGRPILMRRKQLPSQEAVVVVVAVVAAQQPLGC